MNQQPRRLRSSAISLGLVGALALSLSACGTSGASATRRCIDQNSVRQTDNAYQVVADGSCIASASPSSGSFGTTPNYRYYYGGTLNNGYVYGGSFTVPTTSRSSTSSSSRRWYSPSTWRSSGSGSTSGTSSASSGSSTKSSGVSTGGFGSSSSGGSSSKGSSSSS